MFHITQSKSGNKIKFGIKGYFTFRDIEAEIPLAALAAQEDIPMSQFNFNTAEYHIVDGELYAFQSATGGRGGIWYFFDTSTRHWQKCDDPNQET